MTYQQDPADSIASNQQLRTSASTALRQAPGTHIPSPETLAPRETQGEDVIDLRAYWSLLYRRRWFVITVMSAMIVMALIWSFLATPIYRGSVLLQIEQESTKVVEFEIVAPENKGDTKDFYVTQYELLKSRTLARRVIDQLGLRSSPTFAPPTRGPSAIRDTFDSLKSLFSSGDNATETAREPPDYASMFLDHLTVTPVKNSRLVRVHFDSADPQEASAVANAVAENFVNTTLERRYNASAYAKTFLDERIQETRDSLDESERRLLAYAREREIVNLDDKLAILMDRLREMSKELVSVEAERIAAESVYSQMREAGSEQTSGALDSPVIQRLKDRLAELTVQYQENLEVYKPGYPKMQQIKEQITEIENKIAEEGAAISNASRTTYEAKLREEVQLGSRINEIKGEVLAMQDRSTDYQALKREVDTNRQLYDGLLQRMKEVGVVAGIGTNNLSIVDAAEVPQYPFKPDLKKNLAIALAFGLFAGIGLALLIETLDDSIKSTEEVERRLGAPTLTLVPWIDATKVPDTNTSIGLLPADDPKSAIAEAYRSLKTSLIFSTSEGAPKILHFTSASPGEGKSTSASATAITFAQSGNKVLLVDCDLRNPSTHQIFRLANSEGLTNYLTGAASAAEVAKPTEVKRLFAITSGPLPPNPVELLAGSHMLELIATAAERFDYVILDGPPVIGLADALILANLARATLLVVESGGTRAGSLESSVKRLRSANANILGAVFVKHGRVGGAGYGYGYGYSYDYHYTYTYGGKGHDTLPARQA